MLVSKQIAPLVLLLLCLFLSCEKQEEIPQPDVDDIKVELTVLRFDRALPTIDTTVIPKALAELEREYGSFAPTFFTHLVPLYRGDFSPAEQKEILKAYLEYPITGLVDSAVNARFPTIEERVQALERALRYYRHYLPEAPVPDTLIAFAGNFELAAFLYGEGQLAAGLDFFLGPDFDYRSINPKEPVFSDYLSHAYTPEHMVAKLMEVLVDDYLPPPRSGRLIDYLIYEGKRLYLLQLLQPAAPPHIIYGFREEEMQWLRDNEAQIYAYLQREDELYATDQAKVKKYTQAAPTTQGMPPESPGRAVNYLGRQIVGAFVAANPDVSLPELLAMQDGQEILRRARYKPR